MGTREEKAAIRNQKRNLYLEMDAYLRSIEARRRNTPVVARCYTCQRQVDLNLELVIGKNVTCSICGGIMEVKKK